MARFSHSVPQHSGHIVSMKIPIELRAESRDLLVRHFKEGADLHEIPERAARKELAGH